MGSKRSQGLALSGLLACALCLPGYAQSGMAAGGGDAVGSLPGMHRGGGMGQGSHQLRRGFEFASPSLVLTGPEDEIRKVLRSFHGNMVKEMVSGQAESEGTPWIRVRFLGAATVGLDRQALLASSVTARFEPQPGFAGAVGALFSSGDQRVALVMHRGGLDLPLQKLAHSGLLDGGVSLIARTKPYGATVQSPPITLSIAQEGRLIMLRQGQ